MLVLMTIVHLLSHGHFLYLHVPQNRSQNDIKLRLIISLDKENQHC